MPHTPLILAERVEGRIVVHPDPLPIRWDFDGLVSADGHVVHCVFAARVQGLDSSTERRMLAEAMMGRRDRVTIEDIRAHFHDSLRSAAARTIAAAPAERWLTGDTAASAAAPDAPKQEQTDRAMPAAPIREALLAAANSLAFTSGVEMHAPFDLTLDSPTFAQARVDARYQHLIDQRTRRRAEIIQSVLAAGDDPSALPPLPDITDEEAHREHMAALLDVQAMRHPRATLHVVAGQMLLIIDLTPGEVTQPRQLALPDTVGAFRSVNPIGYNNTDHLILGGQRGLLLFHPDYPSESVAFIHPGLQNRMGFNAAVRFRDHLWATHSEIGLTGWSINHPDQPAHTITIEPSAGPPRHPTVLDDHRILFSAGTSIYTFDEEAIPTKITDLPAPPLAIDHRDGVVRILRADGALELRDARSLDLIRAQPPSSDTTQSAILHCLHHPLRLLARSTGEIHLCGDAPTPIRTFASGHRDLRLLRAAPAYIAALSADRTRVVIWPIRSAQPLADLHLAAIAQNRIADFAWT